MCRKAIWRQAHRLCCSVDHSRLERSRIWKQGAALRGADRTASMTEERSRRTKAREVDYRCSSSSSQIYPPPPVFDPCCFPLVEMLDKYFSVRQGSNLRVRHGLILPRWHGCVATTESMWSSFWETGKGFGMLTHLGRWWQKHLFVLAIGDEKLSSENYH